MRISPKGCGTCDPTALQRLPRTFWMRLLPGLRHYRCGQCGSTMLASKKVVESRKWMLAATKNARPPGETHRP